MNLVGLSRVSTRRIGTREVGHFQAMASANVVYTRAVRLGSHMPGRVERVNPLVPTSKDMGRRRGTVPDRHNTNPRGPEPTSGDGHHR